MSGAPIPSASSPTKCAAPSPAPRGKRGTCLTAGWRVPPPCPPSTWPRPATPGGCCTLPPWRLPPGLPGTPAGAQLRPAPQRCPAITAPTPGTPDSAGSRARGGASRRCPRGPGAGGSAVPARPIATSLRVAANPLGGRPAGPCPRPRGGRRVPTLEHPLHQGLHGARHACLEGEPEQALVLHASEGRYIETPGQQALEEFFGPRAPRGAPGRLGRRRVRCRQGAPLDVRHLHSIQRHGVGQGSHRRFPHVEYG